MQEISLFALYTEILEKAGIRYFVTGSVASMLYGEPRLTHYIDLVIEISKEEIPTLTTIFPLENFYCPPEEVIATELRRSQRGHFNILHHETGFKADIYLLNSNTMHLWAMEHKHSMMLDDSKIWIAPPEYVIIRKLQYFKEGGSEKHLRDIQTMLEHNNELIQQELLEKFINDQNLSGEWGKVNKLLT